MSAIFEKIKQIGIVPVVVLDNVKDALPLAKALIDGGLPCAEITYRTSAAEESIKLITEKYPDMLIGAGTVLTTEQVDTAVAAGAKFIVSPGLNPRIVKYCIDKKVPIIPGTSSPSDIEQALEFGLKVVKFFPAEASGGIKKIKAMAAPYGNIGFMPTGGINSDNLNDYLSFPQVLACGGSWMVKKDLIEKGEFEKITNLTKNAIMKMHGFELGYIGINCIDEQEVNNITKELSLFGLLKKEEKNGILVGNVIVSTVDLSLGTKGYLVYKVNNVNRAVSYLSKLGIEFNENTIEYDDMNNINVICLKDEVSGYAIQLINK